MSEFVRSACGLVSDSEILLKIAIELLNEAQPYYAWRLLDRFRRSDKDHSLDAYLLLAKACHLGGNAREALVILKSTQVLFPQSPVTTKFIWNLLSHEPEIYPEFANNMAWSVLCEKKPSPEVVLKAIQVLTRLNRVPIGICRFDGSAIIGWLLNSNLLPALTVNIDGSDYSLKPYLPVPFLLNHGLGSGQDGFSLKIDSNNDIRQIRIHLNGEDLAGSPIRLPLTESTATRLNLASDSSRSLVTIESQAVRQDTPVLNESRLSRLKKGRKSSNEIDELRTSFSQKALEIIDVIVPVYKGYEETRRCLESVLNAKNKANFRLIVIDDASPETELVNYLELLHQQRQIVLLKQAVNSGFVASVTLGMNFSDKYDVVLLNSDTCVHGDWLDRLIDAAYSDRAIGTVTPLSNNGELVSYPVPMQSSAMPSFASLKKIDDICAALESVAYIDLPVGVGFCLYIKRDCLNEVGGFNSQVVERGYCEDTEFCIRVAEKGWRNICAPNVFVAHAGSVSFGSEKAVLVKKNVAKIYALYPEHSSQYDYFLKEDPLKSARDFVQRSLLPYFADKHIALILLPASNKGDYWVERVKDTVEKAGHNLFYLSSENGAGRCFSITLNSANIDYTIELKYLWPADKHKLLNDIHSLNPLNIDIYDIGHWPVGFLEEIIKLPRSSRILLRDYAAYCPRLTLTQPNIGFCNDPEDVQACVNCQHNYGSHLESGLDIFAWRERVSGILLQATEVLLFSSENLRRFQARFPRIDFKITKIPELNIEEKHIESNKFIKSMDNTVLRVAILQARCPEDGFLDLLTIARVLAKKKINVEMIVFGETWDDDALIATGKVWVTGLLEYSEIIKQIKMHGCKMILHLPCWPQNDALVWQVARQCDLPFVGPSTGIFTELIDFEKGDIELDRSRDLSSWIKSIFNVAV